MAHLSRMFAYTAKWRFIAQLPFDSFMSNQMLESHSFPHEQQKFPSDLWRGSLARGENKPTNPPCQEIQFAHVLRVFPSTVLLLQLQSASISAVTSKNVREDLMWRKVRLSFSLFRSIQTFFLSTDRGLPRWAAALRYATMSFHWHNAAQLLASNLHAMQRGRKLNKGSSIQEWSKQHSVEAQLVVACLSSVTEGWLVQGGQYFTG